MQGNSLLIIVISNESKKIIELLKNIKKETETYTLTSINDLNKSRYKKNINSYCR